MQTEARQQKFGNSIMIQDENDIELIDLSNPKNQVVQANESNEPETQLPSSDVSNFKNNFLMMN